ncbi:MAG: hypothetical protein AMJ75_02530 [Phycisphaerae bacterium SM1_79]|nr:MAG: hypothetical protein AMJ75_02530 [Phycisphaerae bacterium SM1_79]
MGTDGNILVSPGTAKTEAKRRFDKRILKVCEEYPDCDIHCLASLKKYMSGDARVSSISPSLLAYLPKIESAKYIENVLDCLLAAMPSCAPASMFLREALQNLQKNHPISARPPTMKDLIDALNAIAKGKCKVVTTAGMLNEKNNTISETYSRRIFENEQNPNSCK